MTDALSVDDYQRLLSGSRFGQTGGIGGTTDVYGGGPLGFLNPPSLTPTPSSPTPSSPTLHYGERGSTESAPGDRPDSTAPIASITAAQHVNQNPSLYGPQLPPQQGPQQAQSPGVAQRVMALMRAGMSYAEALAQTVGGSAAATTAAAPAARPPATPGTSLSGVGGNAAQVPSNMNPRGQGSPWDPQGTALAASQRLAMQSGQASPWDPQGAGYAASQRLAQQPQNNVTSFMGGPPITTGGPFGQYQPTTGNARGATWNPPAPPPAPPSVNLGYGARGGGGGGVGGASSAPRHAMQAGGAPAGSGGYAIPPGYGQPGLTNNPYYGLPLIGGKPAPGPKGTGGYVVQPGHGFPGLAVNPAAGIPWLENHWPTFLGGGQ